MDRVKILINVTTVILMIGFFAACGSVNPALPDEFVLQAAPQSGPISPASEPTVEEAAPQNFPSEDPQDDSQILPPADPESSPDPEPPPPVVQVCGNGILENGEVCDDGNNLDGDGCSDVCVTEFLSNDNLWNTKNQTTGSIQFGYTETDSADGKVVNMLFPGVPGQGSTYKTSPGNATQISTKQKLSFGTYRTRVKFAQCSSTEEVVNGVFVYSYGGDTNSNGITDNNEIDFEVLCGEPQYLYLTSWTDYQDIGGVETFLKVTRVIDTSTGEYYQTRPGKEGVYGYQDYVETDPDFVIPGFVTDGKFYELGFEWTSDHIRFFIMQNGTEVTLWNFTDSQYIPQNAAYFMFNVWHTSSHWWAGGNANYPANNATMEVDWFNFWVQ